MIPLVALLYGAARTDSPGAPGASFTLQNFVQAVSPNYLRALGVTVYLGVITALSSVVVGAILAWIVARTDAPGRGLLESLIIVPTFLPPLVGATGWLVLGAPRAGLINSFIGRQLLGLQRPLINTATFTGVVWVMALFFVPVAYLYILAALRQTDATQEEAARIAGARTWQVLWGITVPSVWPALLTAFTLVWVFASEMFSIPGVLVGPSGLQPLAYKIFLAGRTSPPNHPLAAAAGVLLVLITLLMLFLYRRVTAIEGRYVTMAGKASRPRPIRLGGFRWVAVAFAWFYVLVAVVLPYIALGIGSLQSFFGAKITWQALTLNNWRRLLEAADLISAFRNSLLLGIGAGTVVVIIGAIAAYALARRRLGKGWGWFDYILSLSLGIPGIAFGIGMVWAYIRTPLYGTPVILLVAYVARYIPNGMRAANTGLLQISKDLEEGAAVAGASPARILRDITAPLLKPALFSAWTLTVIIVLRELSMSSVLYTPKARVLAVLAWDYLESGNYGFACVVGLLQTALVLVIITAARILFKVRLSGGDALD